MTRGAPAWHFVLRNRYGAKYLTIIEGDRTDARIMAEIAELRALEDEIDEELRDPGSSISQGYVLIAGERPFPTARYLVTLDLMRDASCEGSAK